MTWPFKPAPAPKSNVIAFPRVKDNVVPFDNSSSSCQSWSKTQTMPWIDYQDMVRDVLVDIRLGNIKPEGMLISILDRQSNISSVVISTMGLTNNDIKALCEDILDGS